MSLKDSVRPLLFTRRSFRNSLRIVIGVAAIALAAFLLYRTLSQYAWNEVVEAVTAVPFYRLLLAMGFSAASYLCLTGFDWLGLIYAGHPLAYRRAALASFTSLSLGHNIGFAALSSGTIRYRFYSRWGLGPGEVAKVIFFCGITVGLGLSFLGGIGLLASPDTALEVVGLSKNTVRLVGLACLFGPAVYLLLAAMWGGRALHFGGQRLAMPSLPLALAQVVVGTLNFTFVAAALDQAISALADVPFLEVATVYVSANVATLITHAPGGLGVIESVVLFLLPEASLIGAVLVFRFVYFLFPLLIGSILLGASEMLLSRDSGDAAS
ncbi:lysylphosphatidylglycerol synthase domain-containing protein [Chelativorans sp. Marseille-P2723]|uniref:lysylphosphatidylglycerol synthase domain-containing protein n=1 Tax=Chelativorans sp. Marseille-P2723 TaxID=2709133 RepID=UPI001FEEBC95|nr:lysylphosphatidylglycerol synthase domain-containing protein [Chelativorans sp. Marseille-P2723]